MSLPWVDKVDSFLSLAKQVLSRPELLHVAFNLFTQFHFLIGQFTLSLSIQTDAFYCAACLYQIPARILHLTFFKINFKSLPKGIFFSAFQFSTSVVFSLHPHIQKRVQLIGTHWNGGAKEHPRTEFPGDCSAFMWEGVCLGGFCLKRQCLLACISGISPFRRRVLPLFLTPRLVAGEMNFK